MGKNLELWARKALECYKYSLLSHSGVRLENQNLREMQTMEVWLMRFKREARTLLGTGLGNLFCILAKNLMFSAHVLRTQVRLN